MYIPGGGQCGCSIAEGRNNGGGYLSTCIYQEVDNVAAPLLKGEIAVDGDGQEVEEDNGGIVE